VLPKRLVAPGPAPVELRRILEAAAAAPDHEQRLPWRFVLVPDAARIALADVFEAALCERDPAATEAEAAQAREKAFRAPVLLLAIVDLGHAGDAVPPAERLVSAGCALQNMLLQATAEGYGSALTSGKALQSAGLRRLFGLGPTEQAVCFLSLGTVLAARPGRARPAVERYVSVLEVARPAR
jgi:nitroreductase